MKSRFTVIPACAAVLAAAQVFAPAMAQTAGVVRLKAKLVAVDRGAITLQPVSDDPKAQPAGPRRVGLLPETRYVLSMPGNFGAIKTGDYVGAAVSEDRDGALRANEVYLYAAPLRGTGEGRFTERGRILVNGTVTNVEPATGTAGGGTLTLHYRGATLVQAGKGKPACEGRATPAPFASALACEGDAAVRVSPDAAISALTVGDQTILTPGAIVTATVAHMGDREVTPGLVVEKPTPVEKPKSSP